MSNQVLRGYLKLYMHCMHLEVIFSIFKFLAFSFFNFSGWFYKKFGKTLKKMQAKE
jgi:hypothetical protein